MTFNCCQKPFFSHKRAQTLSKNLFLPLSLRKTMLLRRDICKSFAVYLQRKPLTSRQTTPYKSQQNRLLPPDRALFKTRRCKGSVRVTPPLPPHRWNTKNNAFRSQQSGIQGRTARQPLADITLDGRTWQPRLPPPPWTHREKACPFPLNQQKVFFM